MGFKDWIHENIYEPEKKEEKPDTKKATSKVSTQPTSQPQAVSNYQQPIVTNTITPTTAADITQTEKFRVYFEDLFDKSNLPGPDYYEFAKTVAELQKANMGAMAFQAAYTSLKVSGSLTKEKLVDTAQQYLKILDQDAIEFTNGLKTKRINEVDSRKNKMAELDKQIAEKYAAIQKLNDEINQSNQQKQTLSVEVLQQEDKLHQIENNYTFASQVKKTSIQNDIIQINSQLQ